MRWEISYNISSRWQQLWKNILNRALLQNLRDYVAPLTRFNAYKNEQYNQLLIQILALTRILYFLVILYPSISKTFLKALIVAIQLMTQSVQKQNC